MRGIEYREIRRMSKRKREEKIEGNIVPKIKNIEKQKPSFINNDD